MNADGSGQDQAINHALIRLSGALERIVDGLDTVEQLADVEDTRPAVDPQELVDLKGRVSELERENEALRAAGRAAAAGIGDTIAALEAAKR